MVGASVPMSTFASALCIPIIGVPVANYDNNQHAANENLRLQNLWEAIDIYAALLTSGHNGKRANHPNAKMPMRRRDRDCLEDQQRANHCQSAGREGINTDPLIPCKLG
jgi:hypothetical protein